jgi:hypothetical protein
LAVPDGGVQLELAVDADRPRDLVRLGESHEFGSALVLLMRALGFRVDVHDEAFAGSTVVTVGIGPLELHGTGESLADVPLTELFKEAVELRCFLRTSG